MAPLQITVLGSGTSVGVPTIGCHCAVCTSEDPRDNRLRPSIVIAYEGNNILIDTTPDFRAQALRAKLGRLDAILYTHPHADHMMGLDDVRPFQFKRKDPIPVFGSEATLAAIHRCFPYAFDGQERNTYVPKLALQQLNGAPFTACGLEFTPIPILHGSETIHGFRFGDAAYLTDHSEIPAESMDKLRGLDVLFLDALRHKPHPTHSTVERSTKTVEELAPKRAFFTHICHDLPHARTESQLPPHIRLAYDGLELRVPEA